MYKFCYDYLKPKYGKNVKLSYVDTDIVEDIKKRFHTPNYEIDRPLAKGKSKKVIGLMKDKLGGQIMK